MKKILAILLCAAMFWGCVACGNTSEPADANLPAAEVPAEPAAEQPAEETPAESEVVRIDRNEGMLPFEGSNLFKLSTAEEV